MTVVLKNIVHQVFNFLVPAFCVHCRQFLDERQGLCESCRNNIKPIVSSYIPVTASRTMTVYSIGKYEEPLTSLVTSKFTSSRVTSSIAGKLTWELSGISKLDFDYIVPVPLHWRRFAKRGYNQAAEMAYAIGACSGKPVADLLVRQRNTPFQFQLMHKARKENLDNAIILARNPIDLTNKHILLVDDLMTTGTTLKACAQALSALQPAHITAVVVCRAV
jgi:competence protein ComFC